MVQRDVYSSRKVSSGQSSVRNLTVSVVQDGDVTGLGVGAGRTTGAGVGATGARVGAGTGARVGGRTGLAVGRTTGAGVGGTTGARVGTEPVPQRPLTLLPHSVQPTLLIQVRAELTRA